ncbi:MAG: hypothetical protein F6K31_03325 [Symploca sp. SIO2G7]|nr:hypothetical protein [Symploca sp. SIO2G7]
MEVNKTHDPLTCYQCPFSIPYSLFPIPHSPFPIPVSVFYVLLLIGIN